ncbi:hypothetical protein [Mucilaginibacter flavidus]|nr:hypothetical protein [Mucilaginibacter flavidus]MCO5949980.1 hypothetical protein [Mucilaginibacter flavidus]
MLLSFGYRAAVMMPFAMMMPFMMQLTMGTSMMNNLGIYCAEAKHR